MANPLHRLFVSHSHADNAWCRDFVHSLRSANIDVWYDEQNLGHGAIRQVIEREMKSRPNFVVALSPAALASHWVADEMDAAKFLEYAQPERILIPVMAEACEVPLFWQRYKRVSGPGDTGISAREAARQVLAMLPAPKAAYFDGATMFISAIAQAAERDHLVLRQLSDWGLSLEQAGLARLYTTRGADGRYLLLPWLMSDNAGLVTLWNDHGAYVSFWRSVFELHAPKSLPVIERLIAPMQLGQGNWTSNISDRLLAALTAAYQEAAGLPNA